MTDTTNMPKIGNYAGFDIYLDWNKQFLALKDDLEFRADNYEALKIKLDRSFKVVKEKRQPLDLPVLVIATQAVDKNGNPYKYGTKREVIKADHLLGLHAKTGDWRFKNLGALDDYGTHVMAITTNSSPIVDEVFELFRKQQETEAELKRLVSEIQKRFETYGKYYVRTSVTPETVVEVEAGIKNELLKRANFVPAEKETQ